MNRKFSLWEKETEGIVLENCNLRSILEGEFFVKCMKIFTVDSTYFSSHCRCFVA